jgi:arginine deiminase
LKPYGSQSMYKKIDRIILKHPRHAFISPEHLKENWQSFHYTGMPDITKALEEYKAFESIIIDHVKNIHYLPPAEEVGLDSIYTHDPVKITVAGAIGFPMGKDLRAKEHRETLKLLNSLDIPTLGIIEHPAKIEGGDVVWIDEETVALGLGYRTNMAGINQFKELTRDFIKEYIIVPLPHAGGEEECLHLMSLISIVDKDLAVVYSKYMPVFFRQYLLEKGFSLVEVPDHEYDNLGSNVLALAPRVCVMMEGNKITEEKLKEHKALVYTYPGREISFKGTGGPTCLTCPVTRD